MWKMTDCLIEWVQSKKRSWRKGVYNEVINTLLPSLSFSSESEDAFKALQAQLPKHKRRYAPGKKIVAQFDTLQSLKDAQSVLSDHNIPTELVDGWAHRSITRDVSWGIPLPEGLDPSLQGKTLYVWPDSLIAPLSFSKVALSKMKKPDEHGSFSEYWCDENAKIYQFLGQDNVFFYVLMQGALWLGSQQDPSHLPKQGDRQLTEVIGSYHLHVNGEKMSKSTGNFFTGDQLIDEKSYHPDQIRHFLSLLSLSEKSSNFEFEQLEERNKFLAGPMNAAFEKPISAVHTRFEGKVPDGKLLEKAEKESFKIVQKYLKAMEIAEYSKLLYAVENYARLINSFFAQYKPHDDRFDEEQRKDALYSSFYILKNLMIMLYPFVPETMDKLRQSLNLGSDVFSIDQLGTGIPAGHKIGEKQTYFPEA
jgi:methionyl-tRNA synthetase